MTPQKRIFVASTPDGQYIAQHALSEMYSLKFASTLREAMQILSESGKDNFDLIIGGAHFDDSRMIELLQFVRSDKELENLPFLAMQALPSGIKMVETVEKMALTLGCCDFVEVHSIPLSKAQKVLQAAVQNSFDKPVKKMRIDRK